MMRLRHEQFDALKCWAILWVVLGHLADCRSGSGLFQSIFLFAYAWHMPVFIFLSGLFDRPRDELPAGKVVFFLAIGILYKLLNFYVGYLLGSRSFWLLGDAVAGLLTAAHLGVFLNLKLPAFFSEIGKRTLSDYFWHTPAITILVASGFYNTLFYVGPVGKLALLFIGALMCWLFSRDLFMRPLERVRASIAATIECKTLQLRCLFLYRTR